MSEEMVAILLDSNSRESYLNSEQVSLEDVMDFMEGSEIKMHRMSLSVI